MRGGGWGEAAVGKLWCVPGAGGAFFLPALRHVGFRPPELWDHTTVLLKLPPPMGPGHSSTMAFPCYSQRELSKPCGNGSDGTRAWLPLCPDTLEQTRLPSL